MSRKSLYCGIISAIIVTAILATAVGWFIAGKPGYKQCVDYFKSHIKFSLSFDKKSADGTKPSETSPADGAVTTDNAVSTTEPAVVKPELVKVSVVINGVDFTFIKCSKCESFEMPVDFDKGQSESIDQDFYIMDSELNIAQYEALKKLNPGLPELSEFNKNCVSSDRNSVQIENKFKPLHGVVPLDNKKSPDALRYADMISKTLTQALNSDKTTFDKDIPDHKTASIPSAAQWYYAAVAVDDVKDLKSYCHLGTIKGKDYVQENCLEILLNSPISKSLDKKSIIQMKKNWKTLWDESSISSEEFKATPEQIFLMLQNRDRLKHGDDKSFVDRTVKSMPLTYLRSLLYDMPSDSSIYLYDSSFSSVKEVETPNNWELYDIHSNASELVLDSGNPAGYSIMGGQNNISLETGWEDNWQRFLLWKKLSPDNLDQNSMPGLRLIFTVE